MSLRSQPCITMTRQVNDYSEGVDIALVSLHEETHTTFNWRRETIIYSFLLYNILSITVLQTTIRIPREILEGIINYSLNEVRCHSNACHWRIENWEWRVQPFIQQLHWLTTTECIIITNVVFADLRYNLLGRCHI